MFTILVSFYGFQMMPSPSFYETLEVLRGGYKTLPVAIDIGHQSQGHYHGSDEPSHIVSLSMVFLPR